MRRYQYRHRMVKNQVRSVWLKRGFLHLGRGEYVGFHPFVIQNYVPLLVLQLPVAHRNKNQAVISELYSPCSAV